MYLKVKNRILKAVLIKPSDFRYIFFFDTTTLFLYSIYECFILQSLLPHRTTGHNISLLSILRLKDELQDTVASYEFKVLKVFENILYDFYRISFSNTCLWCDVLCTDLCLLFLLRTIRYQKLASSTIYSFTPRVCFPNCSNIHGIVGSIYQLPVGRIYWRIPGMLRVLLLTAKRSMKRNTIRRKLFIGNCFQ